MSYGFLVNGYPGRTPLAQGQIDLIRVVKVDDRPLLISLYVREWDALRSRFPDLERIIAVRTSAALALPRMAGFVSFMKYVKL